MEQPMRVRVAHGHCETRPREKGEVVSTDSAYDACAYIYDYAGQ
jgi:hypothetical protein